MYSVRMYVCMYVCMRTLVPNSLGNVTYISIIDITYNIHAAVDEFLTPEGLYMQRC